MSESVKETCCCGATFETYGYEAYVQRRAEQWRLQHRHEMAESDCTSQPDQVGESETE